MAATKKIYCRFPGCKHKGFTSRAGRLYHEKTKHGRAFSAKEPNIKTLIAAGKTTIKTDTSSQFIKVEDVKFVMAKSTKNPKKDEDGDYEYECGKCKHEWNGASKFCPNCGVEFE